MSTTTTPPSSNPSSCAAAPNKYAFQPASKLASSIASGEITSRSLLELFISRIERLDDDDDSGGNSGINAVVVRDFERARIRADEADDIIRLHRKKRAVDTTDDTNDDVLLQPLGSLHGVPFTIKESHDASGLPTTLGNPTHHHKHPPQPPPTTNSHVASSLLQSGAILMGKTSVPLNLCDWQSYNELHGTCRNPWSRSHTPGGSSGGSAAALSAGLTPIEVGSDIGGSIRLPAGFCGVWGLKPTWNLVGNTGSRGGKLAPVELSVVGPMARCASDLKLLLDVLLGSRAAAAVDGGGGSRLGWLPRLSCRITKLSQVRVAVWGDAPAPFAVDAHTRTAVDKVVRVLTEAGCAVVPIDGPVGYSATDIYDIYMDVLCGVYAGRMSDDEYQEAERLAECERQNDNKGFWCRQTMSARELAVANERRWGLVVAFEDMFRGAGVDAGASGGDGANQGARTNGFDVMLCPVALSPAFRHDHTPATRPFFTPSDRTMAVDDKHVPYRSNAFWAGICNGCMLPGVAFPVSMANVVGDNDDDNGGGVTTVRLPVGLQCVGPRRHDYVCIEVARMISMALHNTEFMPLGNPDGCE